MSMVRYRRGELPPLTDERKAELKVLAEMPDSKIDYSEIPPLDVEFLARAVPNPFFKPVKIFQHLRWLFGDGPEQE